MQRCWLDIPLLSSLLASLLATVLADEVPTQAKSPTARRTAEDPTAITANATLARQLRVADEVATWLDATATTTATGPRWPIDVDADQPRHSPYLYSGVAGIVLFYLEHHQATGRSKSLEMAKAAADRVWNDVGSRLEKEQPGLYTGIAGLAITYAELHRSSQRASDRERAVACLDALAVTAKRLGKDGSARFNDVTDIISGSAGIGLALLRLTEDLERKDARELAVRVGDDLVRRGKREGKHQSWAMMASYPRRMPNFSHGTAGVAYFLARLHEATDEPRFLDAARRGADYLLSITAKDGGLIRHNDRQPELFYLGWCHGPPGTARLFTLLHRITSAKEYGAWTDRVAARLAALPIPRVKTPGFWNNHGQCCGTAGIADFFLTLRAINPSDRYDPRIDGLFGDLLAASVERENARSWTGNEHRVRPQLSSTQTGYMQGAAGIGLLFLHDVARRRGAPRRIVLPDSPHPRR